MVRTVVNGGFEVNHFVTRKITVLGGFFDTFSDGFDVFLGNRTADRGVFEYETAAGFKGFELDFTVTVLTFTAGLSFVHSFGVNRFSERFFIGNLRLTDGRFDFEFS